MNTTYKRRNYFIDKEFQGKRIFNAFILVALGSILFAMIFSFFSSNMLSIVYDNYHLKLGTTPGILLNKILSSQWLFIVLGGFLIAVITLFSTHRVAGPFFRLEKTLDSMNGRDISISIKLRPKDEGKLLALKINSFNEMLSSEMKQILLNSEKISQSCSQIDSLSDGEPDIARLRSALQKIERHNENTVSLLNKYKLIKD